MCKLFFILKKGYDTYPDACNVWYRNHQVCERNDRQPKIFKKFTPKTIAKGRL